ncbi:MAG: Alpha/Beta hydrolase protein [Olpidium bornovanus]|uniref:Carboxypeptidase n=1 Tax=Olpidium bornovanus TaxID=278681 RepID=A0A8H8DKR3_9FUNG|nr:MAG: Alpha/Beta hydrolase protein [Olpidium bornovanus]
MTGLLTELGPCRVGKGGNNTVRNDYSWNNNTNLLFVDQPIGAGFSYGKGTATSVSAAKDMHAFFQLFYREFEQYSKLDLHIAGESYAGHYIPQLAGLIVKKNEKVTRGSRDVLPLSLKSVAIGNGLTDPLVQYKYYGEYGTGARIIAFSSPPSLVMWTAGACDNPYGPLVSQKDCDLMTGAYETCARLIKMCYGKPAALSCLPASGIVSSTLPALSSPPVAPPPHPPFLFRISRDRSRFAQCTATTKSWRPSKNRARTSTT